jgi:hypothetical protein
MLVFQLALDLVMVEAATISARRALGPLTRSPPTGLAYSQLAAIQMGWLVEKGTLKWNATVKAANGSDDGCFDVDLATWDAHIEGLAKVVLGIKGRGDKTLAEKTRETFVKDGTPWAALRGTIQERWLRAPKASFVYTIEYR